MAADGRPDPDTWRDGQQALAAALTRLRGERPTAPVVLGGFSQGAAMAAAWTLTTDRPPHALLVFSGYLPDLGAGRAVPGLPVFVGHGLQDPVLPVAHGRQLADTFAARGAVVTARYYTVGHGLHPEEVEDARRFLTECLQPTS
jgi:phospholipase/carboxylesterase